MADQSSPSHSSHVTWGGIRQWLPILLTLAAMLVALGVAQARLADTERICRENREQLKLHDATFLELQIRLAEMQKDLSYIRLTIEQIDKGG